MKTFVIALFGASLLACGGRDRTDIAADSAARDIQLPPADSTVAINDAPPATSEAPPAVSTSRPPA
ncbi:MAG: hypothetical protein ACRENB_16055, partial [Gemmatimonadales bacterium]